MQPLCVQGLGEAEEGKKVTVNTQPGCWEQNLGIFSGRAVSECSLSSPACLFKEATCLRVVCVAGNGGGQSLAETLGGIEAFRAVIGRMESCGRRESWLQLYPWVSLERSP